MKIELKHFTDDTLFRLLADLVVDQLSHIHDEISMADLKFLFHRDRISIRELSMVDSYLHAYFDEEEMWSDIEAGEEPKPRFSLAAEHMIFTNQKKWDAWHLQ